MWGGCVHELGRWCMSAGVRSEYTGELEWAVSKRTSQWGNGSLSGHLSDLGIE